jgi:hypothetical protein
MNSQRIDEIMIENPLLRKYIYQGAAVPPEDVDPDRLDSFIELVMDVVDNFAVQQAYVPEIARASWTNYRDELMRQPAVVDFLGRHGQWFTSTLT